MSPSTHVTTDIETSRTEGSRNRTTPMWLSDFWQKCEGTSTEKGWSSPNGIETTGCFYAKNEPWKTHAKIHSKWIII